ncbi:MAG TPA: sugar phosphate nucleotidyltransferase [Candidatus Limnocylindrales bacterium]|nr:sugar phosphate nucleotidyltransferase [Candidatus Limnocylindrales bacterium]
MKIVVFAGGVGTRLWPLSRKNTPKQFGKIVDEQTMLQIAVRKLFPDFDWKDIFISTGKKYYDTTLEQLPLLPKENIIVEPEMRDVGPAVGLVIAQLVKSSPDEPLVLLWGSDHLVKEEGLFRKMLRAAEKLIIEDPEKIIFIGQKPRYGNQNVGYIKFGSELKEIDGLPIHKFEGFKYAPPIEDAEKFSKDNQHAWNLGYFATTPKFLWKLFEQFSPDLFKQLNEISQAFGTEKYEDVLNRVYPTIEKISFDHAILEKINPKSGFVISADIGWSDIGAWDALKEALENHKEENVTRGNIELRDTQDVLMFNYEKKLCIGIDLSEMVIINTDDVLLMCPKRSIPKIKKFVENLKGTDHEHLI